MPKATTFHQRRVIDSPPLRVSLRPTDGHGNLLQNQYRCRPDLQPFGSAGTSRLPAPAPDPTRILGSSDTHLLRGSPSESATPANHPTSTHHGNPSEHPAGNLLPLGNLPGSVLEGDGGAVESGIGAPSGCIGDCAARLEDICEFHHGVEVVENCCPEEPGFSCLEVSL